MSHPYRIIISGEGGQGILSIAKIMAYAAWTQGKKSVFVPYFSTEKQGGVSTAYVQISDTDIAFPKFRKADLWVALSQRAAERIHDYLDDGTTVIVNSHLVKDLSRIGKWHPHEIDAVSLAKDKLKKPRTFNMIIMGAMLKFAPGLSKDGFAAALDKQFGDKYAKDSSLRDLNRQAFELGFELMGKGTR